MNWVMARIAALLTPYYEKDVPQGVRIMEAEDWAEALGGYPKWAIEKSARWWKSADNPDRRKRPLEGDIEARCNVEMESVRYARLMLSSPISKPVAPTARTSEPPMTNDRRVEVVKELDLVTTEHGQIIGLGAKKMNERAGG